MATRRRRALGPAVALLTALLGGCSSGPSADEQAVCSSIQTMVDRLSDDDGTAAIAQFTPLQAAVGATENNTLRSSGRAFFEVLNEDVDHTQLTLKETVQRGKTALAASSLHLERMIQECNEVGAPISEVDTRAKGSDQSAEEVP